MAIKQLTVFVENKKGTVVTITDILSRNNVNLRALSVAETQDFGILRLIVNDEETAEKVLADAGYLIKITDVVGVKIGDAPGKLSEALHVISDNNIRKILFFGILMLICALTASLGNIIANRMAARKIFTLFILV